MLIANSSTQPWVNLSDLHDHLIRLGTLQPYIGADSVKVNYRDLYCSPGLSYHGEEDSDNSVLNIVIDLSKPSNLENCGIWWMASYAVAVGLPTPDEWLLPAQTICK